MRISVAPINNNFYAFKPTTSSLKRENINFKGDYNYSCTDNNNYFDEPSVFDILRSHMLGNTLVEADEKLKNLSNAEIARLNYAKKQQIFNKQIINNFGRTYNNSYRGESLAFKPEKFSEIKGYGVERVIDLIGYDNYKENCHKNELDYICFDVQSFFNQSSIFSNKSTYIIAKKHEFETVNKNTKLANEYAKNLSNNYSTEYQKAVNSFVNFMQAVEKGHFYISCDHGINKTNKALMLIAYFSPVCGEREYTSYSPSEQQLKSMQVIYKALTPKDKENLGYSESFDKKVKARLKLV